MDDAAAERARAHWTAFTQLWTWLQSFQLASILLFSVICAIQLSNIFTQLRSLSFYGADGDTQLTLAWFVAVFSAAGAVLNLYLVVANYGHKMAYHAGMTTHEREVNDDSKKAYASQTKERVLGLKRSWDMAGTMWYIQC